MAVNISACAGSNVQEVTSQTANGSDLQPLIARCVLGEEQAWRDLHRKYYPVASRFLGRMGLLAGDLDDACQEVFIQVFRYLARFEQRADFQTWLYKLCLSQANRVRRRRRMRESLLRLFGRDTLPRQAAAESEWSEAVAIQRVKQAMCKMRPMHKEVFVLFEFENVDGDGIARILGCPPATVRRRLHYARVEFESLLRAEDAEDGKP